MTDARLELNNAPRIKNDPVMLARLREIVIAERFGHIAESKLESYRNEIDNHAFKRHDTTIQLFVPWVRQVFDLAGATVVEVGCGTGSSAAAFAPYCSRVLGFDISEQSVELAKSRFRIMRLDNARAEAAPPDKIFEKIMTSCGDGQVDVVLMFALIEHQTIPERLQTLRFAHELLRVGGILVVCETPNRLSPIDVHTSMLPFFHTLPGELKAEYFNRSPRRSFTDNIQERIFQGADANRLNELFIRWGDAASYHEFEIALPDVHQSILTDGSHPNIIRLRQNEHIDDLISDIALKIKIDIHPAFQRHYIDFVYEKK